MAWILALGFFSQALFGVRLIVQLFHTERAGKVVSPTLYWQISLLASFLFLTYGIIRNDIVIILGQSLSYFIYIRNLQLKNDWRKFHLSLRTLLMVLPFTALVLIVTGVNGKLSDIIRNNNFSDPILFIGAAGQLLLNFRFVYQWYYSEKHGASILPIGFWFISALASVMIIFYAINKSGEPEPVLLVSQGIGIFAYLRNIFVHYRSVQRK